MSGPTLPKAKPEESLSQGKPCMCPRHKPKRVRSLTKLILDCWQREYDRRPYENLILHGKVYRSKMFRDLTAQDLRVIISFIKHRDHLKSLEIAYMDIPGNEHLSVEFGKALNRLEKVSLLSANVSTELLETLTDNAEYSKIRLLRLSGNELTMQHAKQLRCFVVRSENLEYLDVGCCDLDECSFAMVADAVHKSKSLKAIDMSRIVNRSSVSCVDESKLGSLAAILIWRCPLVEIHLKKCGLDSKSIEPLLEYLAVNKFLVYLDLGSNKIEGYGAEALLAAVTKQSRLVGLDISNNRLGEYGGEAIAHKLPETKLRYVDIARNQIPAKQMHLILSTIKKTFQTRILNVAGNDFDGKTAATLNRQLITKTFLLESLDVSVTYDAKSKEIRVVPCENNLARYNERYFRHACPYLWPKSFFVSTDDAGNLTWNKPAIERKILVNGMFVGPFAVLPEGRMLEEKDYPWNNPCLYGRNRVL